MRDEHAEQSELLAELIKRHNEMHKELGEHDAVDILGFDPDCKFLEQTFIKNHGENVGGMKTMPGVIRDRSTSPEKDNGNKENYIAVPERDYNK